MSFAAIAILPPEDRADVAEIIPLLTCRFSRSVLQAIAKDVELEDSREYTEPVVGAWTFEPEPEPDDCEDDTADVPPVLLLIETLQKASSWQEISLALKNYGSYKQLAWDALTPLEKKRITALTPTEVRKLGEAKKVGKIIDICFNACI
ncbi:hypothetical protein WA1_03195 [Scytonema hofmannii PCC 7110]|uniref:Uncharacterized protein n=1 Tax=Scytonema hofmannii PCC 7110 TaxID=128403 RepID=A0A139XHJ3_9CYAN|nr:hypothetical protein [Scytonema hofmannii]KYC44157.1 hypothetical protein WA1_03195 [Scytonema hofmannii PCC 7110]